MLTCFSFVAVDDEDKRRKTTRHVAKRAFELGVGFEAVSIKIAQAVIAEAEPHRRRFPQLRLRKVFAITSPAKAFTRRTPASGRSGKSETPPATRPLGMVILLLSRLVF